jgi:hypothetical protein
LSLGSHSAQLAGVQICGIDFAWLVCLADWLHDGSSAPAEELVGHQPVDSGDKPRADSTGGSSGSTGR